MSNLLKAAKDELKGVSDFGYWETPNITKALNHYEELLKKEEGVKPKAVMRTFLVKSEEKETFDEFTGYYVNKYKKKHIELKTKYCGSCGMVIDDAGQIYCAYCGKKILRSDT